MATLTDQERDLIQQAFIRGVVAFLDAGYTPEAVALFAEREEVREEVGRLERLYANQQAVFARSRFVGRNLLAELVPGAVAVLGATMAGSVYKRDKNGVVETDAKGNLKILRPQPNGTQVRAATEVLDRIGIVSRVQPEPRQISVSVLNFMFNLTDVTQETIVTDPAYEKHEQHALSREKMRVAIARLEPMIPELRAELLNKIGGALPSPKGKKAPTKRRTAKKTVKKAGARGSAGKATKAKATSKKQKKKKSG